MANVGQHKYKYKLSLYNYSSKGFLIETFCFVVASEHFVDTYPTVRSNVIKARFWEANHQNKKMLVMTNSSLVDRKVCMYAGDAVDEVVCVAGRYLLRALIVGQPPTVKVATLPVLCLPKDVIRQALSWDRIQVHIEKCTDYDATVSTAFATT